MSCNRTKNNRRMFNLHGSDKAFTHKTENCYSATYNEVLFCDPPHVLKTMRNCFACGKLWICDNRAVCMYILVEAFVVL